VSLAFYGDLFRSEALIEEDPPHAAVTVEKGIEEDLLVAWRDRATENDPSLAPPAPPNTGSKTLRSVQAALRALTRTPYFGGVSRQALVGDLKQLSTYLTDQQIRQRVRSRVAATIGPETRVVIAHSLGSVVAYEALCSLPGHQIRALVTLGSPLGIRNVVFDRLDPAPTGSGRNLRGVWPGDEHLTWTNLADSDDMIALTKDLRPLFGNQVRSVIIDNGAKAHSATAYLTHPMCGGAVAAGLT